MSTDFDQFESAEIDEWGFGTDDVDGSQLNAKGDSQPGKYHLELTNVEPRTAQSGARELNLTFTVLHSVSGQSPERWKFYHSIWMSGKEGAPITAEGKQVALNMAIALRAMKKIESNGTTRVVDPETGKTSMTLDGLKRCIGQQYIAEIQAKKENYNGNERVKMEFNARKIWHIHDPAAALVPRNAGAASMIDVPQEFAKSGAAAATATSVDDLLGGPDVPF